MEVHILFLYYFLRLDMSIDNVMEVDLIKKVWGESNWGICNKCFELGNYMLDRMEYARY